MKRCDICLADMSALPPEKTAFIKEPLALDGLREVCEPCAGMLDELGRKIRNVMLEAQDALLKRVFSGMRGFVRDVVPRIDATSGRAPR